MRKSLSILGTLHDTDVAWLARHGQKQNVSEGTVLIREGQPLNSLFIILDGQFSVNAGGGTEVTRLLAGDIVGEISFVDSRPPLVSVTATRQSVILSIKGDVLRTKIENDCPFSSRFYRALAIFLADRLRTTTARSIGLNEAAEELDFDTMHNADLGARRFSDLIRAAAASA